MFPAAENKLQFELYCNHLIVWSYRGFIKSNSDDVNDGNEGTYIYAKNVAIFMFFLGNVDNFWNLTGVKDLTNATSVLRSE